jgi:hypothetical protein
MHLQVLKDSLSSSLLDLASLATSARSLSEAKRPRGYLMLWQPSGSPMELCDRPVLGRIRAEAEALKLLKARHARRLSGSWSGCNRTETWVRRTP